MTKQNRNVIIYFFSIKIFYYFVLKILKAEEKAIADAQILAAQQADEAKVVEKKEAVGALIQGVDPIQQLFLSKLNEYKEKSK